MKIKESCSAVEALLGIMSGGSGLAGSYRRDQSGHEPLSTNQLREEAVQELYANYKKCFPEVPEVSPEEAMKLVQEGQAVLVDVRPAPERSVSRLPGAIAKNEFLNCPDSYRGKIVIAYDTVGYRSGLFVKRMREKGLDLANLRWGLLGWLHAGGKVYDDNGETKRVHVYGCLWNYAPVGCETVR